MDIRQYLRLKELAERSKAEADRSAGIFEEKTRRLKKEFGVQQIKEAKALSETLGEELEKDKKKFEEKTAEASKILEEHSDVGV